MLVRVLTTPAFALLLASCGPNVVCNEDGEIVIPADASLEEDIRWRNENAILRQRRLDAATGLDPNASFKPHDRLEKAASCP